LEKVLIVFVVCANVMGITIIIVFVLLSLLTRRFLGIGLRLLKCNVKLSKNSWCGKRNVVRERSSVRYWRRKKMIRKEAIRCVGSVVA
jgi:hypothetical protein